MNAEELQVAQQVILDAVQPLPPVDPDSTDSDSSSDSDIQSDSDSHSDSNSDTSDDEEPVRGFGYRIGGPGDQDFIFPFMQYLMHGAPRSKVQNYLDTVRRKSPEDFRRTFRLKRRLAYMLIAQLEASGYIPSHDSGKAKKSAELSFLLFLWYAGNEQPLRCLAEIFDVSESSVFRIIRRVVDWLTTLLNNHVQWPRGNAVMRVSNAFAQARGIRKCIGAVDGCHVPIIKPCVPNSIEYWNHKKFHSVNLTAIVDASRKFTMVYCGDPGSFHDIRVFRRSAFFTMVTERAHEIFPDDSFLIGDGGYQGISDVWLIHPFRDTGRLTPNQQEFNRMLSSTRVFVEQAFGILKGRFRRLLNQIPLFDLPFIIDFIISCCILHNMCTDEGDDGDDYYDPNWHVNEPQNNPEGDDGRPLMSRRERLFRELFPNEDYPHNA